MFLLQKLYLFLKFFVNFLSNFLVYLFLQSKHSNNSLPFFDIEMYSREELHLVYFLLSRILFDKLPTKVDSDVDINLKLSINFIL